MIDFIDDLISSTKRQYADNYSYMLRDYNQENETVKGYNGRQLLELLQNCDDEGSKEVLIKLDQDKRQVSIHNTGTPFSEKGYRSLFISNLSSKTDQKKYIGNKGLGFRSIINWSRAIEIQSNNVSLRYSEKNRKINFNSLFEKEIQSNILTEENLNDNVIPLPFLTIPNVTTVQQNGYVTSIILDYKLNYLPDIIKQIKAITAETILFLNNIEKIKFEGLDDRKDISCRRENINKSATSFRPKTLIRFENETSWQIFEKEKLLPEKYWDSVKKSEEFYQIKIAIEDGFEHSSPYLYSFFPTKIQLKQPYILHATFDLDATRFQINDSEKNRFILKKIVKFTTKVAKYFSKEEVSYKPLEILHHSHQADTLYQLDYYDLIKDSINNEKILPCVDNTYKTLEDSIYISDEFGQMLIDIDATKDINCHLIPLGDESLYHYNLLNPIDDNLNVLNEVISVINKISKKRLTLSQRADFIFQIVKNADFIKSRYENKVTFLINDQHKIIKEGEYIYTPITKENALKTPSFTNIQFINRSLFNELLDRFEFHIDENSNKARFIYDQLKGFCNIHSYEPVTLAQKIISETRNRIKDYPQLDIETVKEMNRCLFYNFLQLNDRTILPDSIRVPEITRNGKIKLVDQLMFSNDYPKGKITEIIFENIYGDDDFIGSCKSLGLENENISEVEEFLYWIGLNDFAIYHSITNKDVDLNDYRGYLNNRSYADIDPRFEAKVWDIKNFSSILNIISLEKLFLWIHYDEKFRKQLNDSENLDSFRHYYRRWNNIHTKPSYIKYRFKRLDFNNYSDFIIDEKFSWVNNFSINYSDKYFVEFGVSKSHINSILILLGAKEDFNNLSIYKVAEIINKLPEKFPNGKKTQTIYKRALGHFKKNELRLRASVRLFADDGESLKPFDQSEIYFSDNIKLPKQLMKEYPIFNFPARAGGVEAIDFFNINDLSDIKIEFTSYTIIPDTNNSFGKYLESLKPIILTYRINAVEDNKIQKTRASTCNKITIVLCSEIKYKIDNTFFNVFDYEFIHHNEQTYYIKITNDDTLESLKSNRLFTNSCADILSLSFDVRGDRNEFRHLFSGNYDDVLKNSKIDFGEDTFNVARELLGLTDYKQAFWKAVFLARDEKHYEYLDDLALENLLETVFDLEFDTNIIDYENVNSKDSLSKIEFLFKDLNIELEVFAEHYLYKISLAPLHLETIKNIILSKKVLIKSSIWTKLKDEDAEKQALYLNEINKYENYYSFASEKSEALSHQFNLDENKIFNEYKELIYPGLILVEIPDFNIIKSKNSQEFTEEDLYEISQSERHKSLLYFEGALDVLKTELDEITNNVVDNDEKILMEVKDGISLIKPQILSSELLKPKQKVINRSRNNVYTPKEKDAKILKQKGNTAEEIVYNHLILLGYNNVDLVGEDNEGLQCDIRYTDEMEIVKYVEVKSFDNGIFHLSKAQYNFGESNQKDYEIWLVKDKLEIIPIYDFFSNPKYQASVSIHEYIIHLELETFKNA